jgi:hypothetical protein
MADDKSGQLCPRCGMSYESHDHELLCGDRKNAENASARCGWGEP